MPPPAGDRAVAASPRGRALRRLSPEDRSILELETATVAGHTCKVIVLGGAVDLDELRFSVAARLHRAPELHMRLAEIDGEPWWVSDDAVDVDSHVVHPVDVEGCDDAGLRDAVARAFEQRLDRSRPLWRIDVIPRLADGGSALVWRIHHALADGTTAMRMARAALWDENPDGGAHATTSRPQPGTPAALGPDTHPRLQGLRAAGREAPHPWLQSPFDGHIGAQRAVAFAGVELEPLRRVAHSAGGATVNDAVLAVVAGGLRRWLEAHHGHLGAVRVKVPVSLHGPAVTGTDAGAQQGNRDSFFCLDLPLGSADPLDRLSAIRRATRVRKQDHDAQHLDALMRRLADTPQLRQFAERVLVHPRSFALNVSNVPGPRQPVHVLGVPVHALYSLAEIREHHALRIAVTSLSGALNFGLVADPVLVSDVDRLARELQAEAAALSAGRRGG